MKIRTDFSLINIVRRHFDVTSEYVSMVARGKRNNPAIKEFYDELKTAIDLAEARAVKKLKSKNYVPGNRGLSRKGKKNYISLLDNMWNW